MDSIKSLDTVNSIITALLADAHALHGDVFNTKALRDTTAVVTRRIFGGEKPDFATEVLPSLGKALDRALLGIVPMNKALHGLTTIPGSELPRLFGEFFMCIFDHSGRILPNPCIKCIRVVRDITYSFYKYELPYPDEKNNKVLEAFKTAEKDLSYISPDLAILRESVERSYPNNGAYQETDKHLAIACRARDLLHRLFRRFDPLNIVPCHGPGAVSTRQRLWGKFQWTNVSDQITAVYPFDAYFCASMGHVCDTYDTPIFKGIGTKSYPAKVVLVPKDSRGPRLISCEPVDNQWIQQGLRTAMYDHVEKHYLTRYNVFFTDQGPNQRGALLGSSSGRYASLDLKEASDRVHLDLVRCLFPTHICEAMEACRSSSTVLPSGEELNLLKFAPMGSALCFPVMALTIWSILTAAAPNADTRESIAVYGDDIIVPTAFAESAMIHLEAFGLIVNQAKSCTTGFFRESCGVDAFKGVNVTPVKFKTVWESSPRPDIYTSWIAYANAMWDRQYYRVYQVILDMLINTYGVIPSDDMKLSCPSLRWVPLDRRPKQRRWNLDTQKVEYRVLVVRSRSINKKIDGWDMLLRYFTEGKRVRPRDFVDRIKPERWDSLPFEPFRVSQYTNRDDSMLSRRWR